MSKPNDGDAVFVNGRCAKCRTPIYLYLWDGQSAWRCPCGGGSAALIKGRPMKQSLDELTQVAYGLAPPEEPRT